MAVTVAQLEEAVAWRCGLLLDDVGRYLDGATGTTRAIREGLRVGVKAIGLPTADPLALADADLIPLSGPAAERVLDLAELYALRVVLLRWPLAMKTHGIAPVAAADDTRGGTLWSQQQAIRERVRDLEAIVALPYASADSGLVAVVNRDRCIDPCWPCPPIGACD